jgi:hypothetical protein
MRGYFSRIARQSGARVRSDAVRADRVATDLSPIDHEETVLVSPEQPVSASMPSDVDVSEPKVTTLSEKRSTPRSPSAEKAEALSTPEPKSRAKKPAENVRRIQAAPEKQFEEPSERLPAENAEREKRDVRDVVEQAVVEQIADADPPVTAAITIQPSEKRFFEKTTGLIEGRAAEPADVHTILLREVQEWIEAGHPADDEPLPEPTDAVEIPSRAEELAEREQRPGVIRVMEARRREKVHEKLVEVSTPTSITEQSFELSIGSISVVIDGDDRPAETTQHVAAPRPSAPETPRTVSRLSRHYL